MCTISAITFSRYAQNGKIGMPNNLEVFGVIVYIYYLFLL
jgi:hypothetical protein